MKKLKTKAKELKTKAEGLKQAIINAARAYRGKKYDNKSKKQYYTGVIFKDQLLSVGLIQRGDKSWKLIDNITVEIKQLVVDSQNVRDTKALSKTIKELSDLLVFENGKENEGEIPIILLLDSAKFNFAQLRYESEVTGLTTIKESILSKHKSDIYDKSPYIENDTVFDIFSYNEFKNSIINLQFGSKKYVKSWVETIRDIEKKIAYIGSCNLPHLLTLLQAEKGIFMFYEIGKFKSKIYKVDEYQNIEEYPFPYGYQQFKQGEVVDSRKLLDQIDSRVKAENICRGRNDITTYFAGIPSLKSKDATKNKRTPITGLFKKELEYYGKSDNETFTEEMFKSLFITMEAVL